MNKKLGKISTCCALAMALTMTTGSISVFAAGDTDTPAHTEVNTVAPDDADKASDPTKRAGINPTATDDPTTTDANEAYSDTDIDVWAFSENTKYSVDVEWGAMTFKYEAEWDTENHKMKEGGSWKIYDSTTDAVVDGTEDAINKVTITNHSNAAVYAKLSYAGETTDTDYSGTTGKFAKPADGSSTTNTNATWTATDATNNSTGYYTLQSAANADGTAGTPAVGNVFFTPNGISDAVATSCIEKWTKIGKITVAIQTNDPATPATPTP